MDRSVRALVRLLGAAILIISIAPAAGAQRDFSDSEFAISDWNRGIIRTSGTGSGSASQEGEGGNPDAYRRGRITFTRGTTYEGHRFVPAVHDPRSAGAVRSVAFEMDVRSFAGDPNCGGGASDPIVDFALWIRQGDHHYIGEIHRVVRSQAWHTVSNGGLDARSFSFLTSSDEDAAETAPHPDFSSNAAPLEFGFIVKMGTGGSRNCYRDFGVDNFFVGLTLDGDQGAGVQYTLDGDATLVSKDVGSERWAITYRLSDGRVSGNVFQSNGGEPSFLTCDRIATEDGVGTFRCYGADRCTSPRCPEDQYSEVGTAELPLSFFFPRNHPVR